MSVVRTVEDVGPYNYVYRRTFVCASNYGLHRVQMCGSGKQLPYNQTARSPYKFEYLKIQMIKEKS